MPLRFNKRYDWGVVLSSVRNIVRPVDWRVWGAGSIGILAAVPASAQDVSGVDAGSLLRQEEMKQRAIPRELPKRAERLPLPTPVIGTGDLVRIQTVRFDSNLALLPESERRSLIADSIGKDLDFFGLTALTGRVTAALKKRGWLLARAYMPPQDLTSGDLTISLVSGHLDSQDQPYRVEAEGKSSLRISKKRLEYMARAQVKPGQPVSDSDLTRALLLMNDLPGLSVRAALEPGQEAGSTRIALLTKQGRLLRPGMAINNFGGESTGVRQVSANLGIDDPFGWGDRITAGYVKTRGMTLQSLSYQLPVGFQGRRFFPKRRQPDGEL